MAEFFTWLNETPEGTRFLGAATVVAVGLFFYIMNAAIFINDLDPKKKWVSMVPPLGGLLIAVGILIGGGGWWALLGLTDPSILVFLYSMIMELVPDKKRTNTERENDENGGSSENNKSDE